MSRKSHYMVRDRWSTRAVEWVLFALAWGFRWITRPVPDWTLTTVMGRLGGTLALLIPAFRRRAERNLDLVWPALSPSERRAIVAGAARHFTRLMVEYARLDWFLPRVEIRTSGIEHLPDGPAVLVTAHYGNWETARRAAKEAGHEVGIIYRAFNNRYLDRFTLDLIPIAGEPVLQKGREGMRALVTHVRRGGKVMILVDQRNSGAPFIDFLGHPAETVTAAADLAHRTGAALIPVRAFRNVAERRFDVTFEPPVTGSDPAEMMLAVNDRIGNWVREAPEQWFWFHRRWRTTTRSRDPEETR